MKDVQNSNSFDIVAELYDIDKDLLMVEHDLFHPFKKADSNTQINNPSDILSCTYENDLVNFLPHFSEVVDILNVIPSTSASSKRSFSGLRRLKTLFTKHYGQVRLRNLTLICIERYYSNMVLRDDMGKVIDKFASSHNRAQHFF